MIGTFTIISLDRDRGLIGVAMASGSYNISDNLLRIKTNAGAIVSQGYTNSLYTVKGIALLSAGKPSDVVLKYLLSIDPDRKYRQVGIVDKYGNIIAYTGKKAPNYHGHIVDKDFAVIGNFVVSKKVIEGIAYAYKHAKLSFPERLILALEYGAFLGGDRRGTHSAALVIKKFKSSEVKGNTLVNLRVSSKADPINLLKIKFQRKYKIGKKLDKISLLLNS
ncbi:MAG: DUF1028 domain-containing protein [Candidatus Asgardarchaeia archaeon]